MNNFWRQAIPGIRHWLMSTWYRSRYLIGFTLIGFASICLELFLITKAMPQEWPLLPRALLALGAGIVFGYALNSRLNFQVARQYQLNTFLKYSAVSVFSFTLNYLSITFLLLFNEAAYWQLRLLTASTFFLFAYALHRIYTFDQARNLGVAVYASDAEDVGAIYDAIGGSCDHIHVDLVDKTMGEDPLPVNESKVDDVRRYWPSHPIALHLMTCRPSHWIEILGRKVDWILIHLEIEEDLLEVIFQCRQLGKKVGIVWRLGNPPSMLLPYLAHVDFVMVLGIPKPGQSGQTLAPSALDMVARLDEIRLKYGFELMFDGGVNQATVSQITAKYIVSASAVLRANNPIRAVHELRREVHFPVSDAA